MLKPSIRIGELSKNDLENFPRQLRRMLVIDAAMIVLSLVGILVVSAFLKIKS